jgi:hypothetical protein
VTLPTPLWAALPGRIYTSNPPVVNTAFPQSLPLGQPFIQNRRIRPRPNLPNRRFRAAAHQVRRAKQKVQGGPLRSKRDSLRSTFLHQFQEVDPASRVASNNAVRACECATKCGGIRGERSHSSAGFQIPHLQRVVIRSGNRTPSVRTHRHTKDRVRVA